MRIVRISDLSEEERKKAVQKQEERFQKNEEAKQAEIKRVNKLIDEQRIQEKMDKLYEEPKKQNKIGIKDILTGGSIRLSNGMALQGGKDAIERIINPNKAKQEDNRKWFEPGAFKDGYQFGDLSKTVTGTLADVGQDLTKGVAGIGEGLVDTTSYLVDLKSKWEADYIKSMDKSKLSEKQRADLLKRYIANRQVSQDMRNFIQRDLIEESKIGNIAGNTGVAGEANKLLNNRTDNKIDAFETDSVLGDKSDSLVQSAGQLAGQLGLTYVGVPWWVTSGTTAFAGGTEEAFNSGATEEQAGMYGLINAGAEILSEKISGGISFGGKTLDTGLKEVLTKQISDRTLKALTKFGFDATGEGLEEVVTQVLTRLGQKLTYAKEDEWREILSSPEAMDRWINETIQHINPFTNEEARAEYGESFIGGAVLGGGANTIRLGNALKNNVDYDTGLTVEQEAYVERELQRQIQQQETNGKKLTKKEINNIKDGIISDIQKGKIIVPQQESLPKAQNQPNNNNVLPTAQTIQGQNQVAQNSISEQTEGMLNNKELPMQSYQYEISDNAKINNLRQDANRYFNNSEKARNYVSMLEKIITDKDIEIRLDGNLKTADGRIANGSYSNGVITINPNSTRAGEFIAIHELTHAIGTKEMLNMINTYRNSNPEFDTAVKGLLKNYQGTEITEEALSDVAGQLFGNQEFINNIAQNNPNIFQKLYSEIKYLWHQFRGYKNQNQFIEDLYYKWTQAYKNNNSNIVKNNEMLYNSNESESDIYDTTRSSTKYENPRMETENEKVNTRSEYEIRSIEKEKYYESNRKEVEQSIKDEIKRNFNFEDDVINEIYNNVSKDGITEQDIYDAFDKYREIIMSEPSQQIIDNIQSINKMLRNTRLDVSFIKRDIADWNDLRKSQLGKFRLANDGMGVDTLYKELLELFPGYFDSNITNPTEQLLTLIEWRNITEEELLKPETYRLTDEDLIEIKNLILNSKEYLNSIKDIDFTKNNTSDINDVKYSIQESENNSGSFSMQEYETVNMGNNKQYQRKILRAFKDKVGNEFRLYKLLNNHNELEIKENGQKGFKTLRGTQGEIIREIQKYWEGQGTFTEIDIDKRYSQNNKTWQQYLDENFKSTGTRTSMQDILPTAKTQNNTQNVAPTAENNVAPIAKKKLNPTEIANLTMNDANTTPELRQKHYAKGNKQSSFFRNVIEDAQFLNKDLRQEMSQDENIRYYKGITNAETLEKAYTDLQNGGQNETMRWFNKESKDISPEDVVKGWILLKQYQDKGDHQSAVEVAKKMRNMGTKAGQAVQAYNILSRLTPEGMFYYAQSELSEAYNKMAEGKSKEWIDDNKSKFDLTPEETQIIKEKMESIQGVEDERTKKIALAEIQKIITNKIPPTASQSIKSWMRISMLFNPKTQVRNIAGNAVILPVNMTSDFISSGIDRLISKKTGVRTTGNTNLKNYAKGFGKGIYESYDDFRKGINTRNIEGNRFEVTEGKNFKDKGIGKALNRVDNMLSFMLDAGDRGFYEATFTNSINNQLVLNNTTKVTPDMIDIATQEALQRTWQDNNTYTNAVLKIRKLLNFNKGYGLGDILIPFAKTPANLTKAIIDYSPVGLTKTLAVDARKLNNSLQNGQYTPQLQHKFVQDLGKGMAGTLLYVLGYALAKAGVITGEADEDKDVKNFMKNSLGINSYSIKIGDKSFAYDWAQPVATPFAIMANFEKYNRENPDASVIDKAINSINIGSEQLLQQSFMESINTVLNGNGTALENISQAILELPSRAVPTLSKQVADMIDGTQRTSFEYGKPVESAVNSVVAKIPGLSKTLTPSVDTLGNEIQKYGGDNGMWNVMFNPANMNKGKLSKAGEEIYNVYMETGDATLLPRTAPYYIDSKGEKKTMTSAQRSEFQKITGEYVEDTINGLLNNKDYKKLSNDKKAELINEIVSDSYSKAKYEVLEIDSEQYEKLRNTLKSVSTTSYYDYKSKTEDMKKDNEKLGVLVNSNYTNKEKQALYENYIKSTTDAKYDIVKTVNNFNISTYLEYKLASSNDQFKADKKDDGTVSGKTISGSAKNKKYDYIINMKNTPYMQKVIMFGLENTPSKSDKATIVNYISSLPGKTNKEKLEILDEFSWITIYKNGTIKY